MPNVTFFGMAATLDNARFDAGDFPGGYKRPMDNIWYNSFNVFGFLIILIIPVALIGEYSGSCTGSNVEIAISWIMGWTIIVSMGFSPDDWSS